MLGWLTDQIIYFIGVIMYKGMINLNLNYGIHGHNILYFGENRYSNTVSNENKNISYKQVFKIFMEDIYRYAFFLIY